MNAEKRYQILSRLRDENPNPTTELKYSSDFELLIAVILSAQATDISVNKATEKLYPVANTPEGIKFAADNGYESIDLDMLITKDGHMVATHYSQPMKKDGFYDPLKKIDEGTKVSDMTLAEVMRLRNEDGQSQIYPMSRMIEELKKNGIAGDFEAKNDSRFTTDEVMGGFADMVRDSGIRANLKSIDRSSESREILEAAQRQGFWVRTAAGNDRPRRDFGYGE